MSLLYCSEPVETDMWFGFQSTELLTKIYTNVSRKN